MWGKKLRYPNYTRTGLTVNGSCSFGASRKFLTVNKTKGNKLLHLFPIFLAKYREMMGSLKLLDSTVADRRALG